MFKLLIFFGFITTAFGAYSPNQVTWWDTDDYTEYSDGSTKTVPFPQCLLSGSKSNYLQSSTLQKLFDKALLDEEQYAKNQYDVNSKNDNYSPTDDDTGDAQSNDAETRSAAAAAIKLTRTIMTKLACDLNVTDSDNLNTFLQKFAVPGEFCSFRDKPDCTGKIGYRTPDGTCNNLDRPYDGSARTAFARIKPAAYTDSISEPRRKSVRGGLLPACRKVSLSFGTKPVFDRKWNHLFVVFGQYIGHDMALSLPVSDTASSPISSCTCGAKYDWNKCTVIDVQPDDPYLRGQQCMAFPATAQAFKDQICSLGVKEQLNGNTHFIDLSTLYGNSLRIALALRGDNGTLKSTRRSWLKYELPPAQREGKSCIDGNPKQKCFAAGDSRVMIELLFTGIHTMHLRFHNLIARALDVLNPTWSPDRKYEVARQITIAYFQLTVYKEWLPPLLGSSIYEQYLGSTARNAQTTYDPTVSPTVYNEIATAAFRLHTLCRDLFSRCTPDGKRIDQLWLNDILQKAKYAYDIENNGLDSIICGSLYDYGFAHDGNFAHQIRDRMFESTNKYGQMWRNDLIAINICRGREHGLQGYNSYRQQCGYPKVIYFEDFSDTINFNGIRLLKKLYKHPDDVDLFVGLNLEDPVPGGIVGPVSACLLGHQFQILRDGDRLFYSHTDSLPPAYFNAIVQIELRCFICYTVDIYDVFASAFEPPSDGNDKISCSTCPPLNADTMKSWLQETDATGDDDDASS